MTLSEMPLQKYLFLILTAFITAMILDSFLPIMPEICEGNRFDSRLIVLSN